LKNEKEYVVHYEKTLSYDVFVKATSKEGAKEKVEKNWDSAIENSAKSEGYIEYCYTDILNEEENNENNN